MNAELVERDVTKRDNRHYSPTQPAALDLAAHGALHEPQFTSSVPLLGPLIVLLRRAWNWMSTRWYVLPLIWQQTAVNQKTSAVVGELVQWQEINMQHLAELEARVQELEARLARYESR